MSSRGGARWQSICARRGRRTGRILRGIVTHAGGRVGPRRRANPPGGRIISTRELTYVRRRLTVLIAMFSVVTMVVLLSVRGCSNDGDGSSGSVSSAGAARSGATVDPTDGSAADDGSSDESFSDKSGSGRVRSQSASRSMFKAAMPAPAQPERDLTAQASAALAGVFSGARYSVSVVGSEQVTGSTRRHRLLPRCSHRRARTSCSWRIRW